MKRILEVCFVFLLFLYVQSIYGQADPASAIKEALVAKYALTTPTADKTNIAKTGSVLILKKNNLAAANAGSTIPLSNTYKNGEIAQGMMAHLASGTNGTRTFVTGEKLWVINIDVKSKGIVFTLFSDDYSGVHYQSSLAFPFTKGSMPSPAEAIAMVSEVFDVESSGSQPASSQAAGQQIAASQAGGGAAAAAAPPAPVPVVDNTPWDPKYGRLTNDQAKTMKDQGIQYDLNFFRLNPSVLDTKPVMQYFIALNNCNDHNVERAIYNELDYPALASYYKSKAAQILAPLPRRVNDVVLYRFIGGGQSNGWHMWSQSLSLGEYNTQRHAFPLKYPGKNDVEVPASLTSNIDRRSLSESCPIAVRAFSGAARSLPNQYSIALKPATYTELPLDETAARKYIDSAGQQRSVFMALDVVILDSPVTITHSSATATEATFQTQVARVRIIDGNTLKAVGSLYDDHSGQEVQVAQAPAAAPSTPAKPGNQWAAGDHLYEIRQAVYISLAASACNWPLTTEQSANLKRFLDAASNGKFNDKYQYNVTDTRVRDAINAKGRVNFCADPVERRDFDKAAATVAPLGPIASPTPQSSK